MRLGDGFPDSKGASSTSMMPSSLFYRRKVASARSRPSTPDSMQSPDSCVYRLSRVPTAESPVLSGNSSRKLWQKFADFRGSYRTGGSRSTPWMKQRCRSDGPTVIVIWARLARFVVWPPCLGQRTALRHL
jgi:hypothetical protein